MADPSTCLHRILKQYEEGREIFCASCDTDVTYHRVLQERLYKYDEEHGVWVYVPQRGQYSEEALRESREAFEAIGPVLDESRRRRVERSRLVEEYFGSEHHGWAGPGRPIKEQLTDSIPVLDGIIEQVEEQLTRRRRVERSQARETTDE